ncbi:MAG: hypothetical protein Q9170_003693 [Blastenia crenularia]
MDVIGICAAIAQVTPAIVRYCRAVKSVSSDSRQLLLEVNSTSGVVLLLQDLANETSPEDPWASRLQSLRELLGQYELMLRDLANKLESATKSKLDHLKWPFEKKAVVETLTNLERYKASFMLFLQAVQEDISLSIKRTVEDTQFEIRQTREDVEWLRDSQEERDQEAMLQWVSPLDFHLVQTDSLHRRQHHTGDWILQEPTFHKWASGDLATLCCEGIPGAGKTVIAAIVVDCLRGQSGAKAGANHLEDSTVSYLYCMFKDRDSQTAENLVGSIVKQITQNYPKNLFPLVRHLYQAHRDMHDRPLLTELVSILGEMLRSFQRNYIVMDALDECTDETRGALFDSLELLQENASLKVILTARPGTLTEIEAVGRTGFIEIRAHDEDIKEYLSARISSERRSFAVLRRKTSLIDLAIDKILDRSQGMFLLARLHLDSIAKATSEAALKISLEGLPRQLSATYDEALRRLDDQDEQYTMLARKVLAWVLYAPRSLTMLELQHALAAESTTSGLSVDEQHIISPDDIVYSCAGLVTLDKKTDVIRMVHYSLQEYFLTNRQAHFPDGHNDIAAVCLKYLKSDPFSVGHYTEKAQVKTDLERNPFLDYAAHSWGYHAREAGTNPELTSAILDFMAMTPNLSRIVQISMQEFIYRPWPDYPAGSPILPPLLVAANFGVEHVATSLLDQGADIDGPSVDAKPLSISALGVACQNGHQDVVRLLLKRGADPRKPLRADISALHRAAALNHPAVVEMLLKHDPKIHNMRNVYGKTALHDAAERGFAEIVGLLLRSGADASAQDDEKRTPLVHAANSGNIPTAQKILDAGAPVDRSESREKQATYAAAASSQYSMLQYLFDRGAAVDARGIHNNNVLHGAVVGTGDPVIVRLIIDLAIKHQKLDAVLSALNIHLKTPLHDAVERNRLAAVAIILEHDPEMNPDLYGLTPLHLAVHRNFPEMTRLLLQTPRGRACVHVRSKPKHQERTPLEVAVERQYVDIIKMISEAL